MDNLLAKVLLNFININILKTQIRVDLFYDHDIKDNQK